MVLAPVRHGTAQDEIAAPILWADALSLGVEGRGWEDVEHPFDRLPAHAKDVLPPDMWLQGRTSAGLQVRFVTAATEIHLRWTLAEDLPLQATETANRFDLYARVAGGWRWVAASKRILRRGRERLIHGLSPGPREYLLYLPLFQAVERLSIGAPPETPIRCAPAPPPLRPVVFYGSSIVRGKGVSRPGMSLSAQLSRRLARPVVNLGFSGAARMELEAAALLGDLDAEAFVIACLPNLHPRELATRVIPFLDTLRAAHPDTPILLVEDRTLANAWARPAAQYRHAQGRRVLREAFTWLRRQGDPHLHYLAGDALLGEDGEATIDGSHPSDLGYVRMADAYQCALADLLR